MAEDTEQLEEALAEAASTEEGTPASDILAEALYAGLSGNGEPEKGSDEEPTGKPDEAKPDEQAGGEEPPPKPDEGTPKSETWDAQRQRRDQEHANERRSWTAERKALEGKLTGLETQVRELVDGQRKAAAETVKAQKAEAFAEVKRQIESLDDATDPEIATALKRLYSLVEAVGGSGEQTGSDDAKVRELEARLGKAEEALSKRLEAEQERAQREAAKDDEREWGDFLIAMRKNHGAQHQAAAIQAASSHFGAKGYTRESPPPHEAALARIELEWERLAAKGKGKGSGPKSPEVRLAAGQGGAATTTAPKQGTVEEVGAAMRREGKFKDFEFPE